MSSYYELEIFSQEIVRQRLRAVAHAQIVRLAHEGDAKRLAASNAAGVGRGEGASTAGDGRPLRRGAPHGVS